MLRQPLFYILILLCSCTADTQSTPDTKPKIPLFSGEWRMVFDLGDAELPINLTVREEGGLKVDFHNAEEVITAHEYTYRGDSLFIRMPLFDSEFCGVVSEDGKTFTGLWRNYGRDGDYALPFTAQQGFDYRFCESKETMPVQGLADKYEVHFSPNDSLNEYAAIGLFSSSSGNNEITGTFLTETGDYRFLEGNLCEGTIALSCFDGSHVFLFTAEWDGTELSNGIFRSGSHWAEPWTANASADFELEDPNNLTFITDSSAVWETAIINPQGTLIRLNELGLKDKVVIVQVMGSWCPNCIDETRDYADFYNRFHERGLEIIPISFENTTDPLRAYAILAELEKDLQLPYSVYYGGKKSKGVAATVLPSLNHIMSFPTSIIIGRDGSVQKVHTGFYGPGTGLYYEHWKHDMEMLLDSLLSLEV